MDAAGVCLKVHAPPTPVTPDSVKVTVPSLNLSQDPDRGKN